MPVSDDQKAMLRALSEGKQSYDDLAALTGLSVEEVRAKVADAVGQLVAEGKPVPALPAAPEPAATPESAKPEPPAPAAAPAPDPEPAKPSETEPSAPAVEEKAAPAPQPAKPAATPHRRTPPPRPNVSLPGGGGARAAVVAGALVLVAVVVILIVGGGDSEDSGSGSGQTTASESTGTPTSNSDNPDVTQAILKATDGSDAEGIASFGRVKNTLALQIEADGLDPSGDGESYTVWLAQSPQKMLPLATTTVGEEGKIAAQTEVPVEVLGYLADETFTKIVVTKTDNAALQASLKKATAAKEAPAYTGEEVLNGTVTGPIVGAAKREKANE